MCRKLLRVQSHQLRSCYDGISHLQDEGLRPSMIKAFSLLECNVEYVLLVTDVSRQPVGSIFKNQLAEPTSYTA
jgi:hypothetical protein